MSWLTSWSLPSPRVLLEMWPPGFPRGLPSPHTSSVGGHRQAGVVAVNQSYPRGWVGPGGEECRQGQAERGAVSNQGLGCDVQQVQGVGREHPTLSRSGSCSPV